MPPPCRHPTRAGGHAETIWLAGRGPDPEVPVISVVDLGIVRDVRLAGADGWAVTVTPTYSGCPATK
jgi:ring-1,2-phenylacetyl-CoA epoxidase subunit PaaD